MQTTVHDAENAYNDHKWNNQMLNLLKHSDEMIQGKPIQPKLPEQPQKKIEEHEEAIDDHNDKISNIHVEDLEHEHINLEDHLEHHQDLGDVSINRNDPHNDVDYIHEAKPQLNLLRGEHDIEDVHDDLIHEEDASGNLHPDVFKHQEGMFNFRSN
jgi:hypothetical protein